MSYVIDTQAIIWFVEGNKSLPPHVRMLIEDPSQKVQISIASIWEIGIKISIGKLLLNCSLSEFISQLEVDSIGILPIEPVHVIELLSLPDFHKDPFDRMIISQAISTQSLLVSADSLLQQYPVKIVW